jgi:HEAT repeat protein
VARGSGGVGDVVRRTLTLDPEQRADELERLYGGLDAAQRIGLLKQLNPTWSVNATALVERFLVKRLKDADPVARKTALQNLTSAFGYNSAAAHLIGAVEAIDLLNDPDPGVAQAAGVLLGALPYKSLAPLAARALLGSVDDPSRRDAVIRQAARLDREFLILCLQHKDSAVRRAARDQILPWHWDRPEVCLAILTGIERLDELPAGAPSGGDSIPQILQAALKNPARGAPYFALIGRIDDERAGEALKQAARAPERAVRWAALDALVARGDESNATLDHALARLLTAEQESERAFLTWPVLSSRLLARLDTFKAICRADRVERLRTEIQGKLNALAALGEPVR